MARTLTIDSVRLFPDAQTTISSANGTVTITASYTVGTALPPNNGILSQIDHPGATNVGMAAAVLGRDDNPGAKFDALIGTICAQEQLDPTTGDQIILP